MLNTQLQADVLDYTEKLVKSTQDLEYEKTDKALVQVQERRKKVK